jgi:hypothetical protein
VLRNRLRRKPLEVLFDGRPEADALRQADARSFFADPTAERKLTTIPADANARVKLSKRYTDDSLGEIAVEHARLFDSLRFWRVENRGGQPQEPSRQWGVLSPDIGDS